MKRESIKNKKIILYGDERYIRDFLYVFDDIVPAYYVNDEIDGYAEHWEKIKEETLEDIMVIVCKYDELQASSNLRSIGLERGKNFISAEVCFEWLDFPITQISKSRDVYVWGAGEDGDHFFRNYLSKHGEIHIVGVIDSDPNKAGKSFFGRTIYLPEDIISSKNAFIIIATKKYYNDVRKMLESAGMKNREDFISFVGINQYASEMMKRTIYDVPKIDFLCEKPFKALELKPEGRILICGGMNETYVKVDPMYYSDFTDIWSSSVLKVIRLSCVNGTYTFCNPQICCYIRESGISDIDVDDYKYLKEKTEGQLQYLRKKKRHSKNTVLNRSNYEKREEKYPKTVQMGFDESCNLHCPSCRKEVRFADSDKLIELDKFKKRVYEEIIGNISKIKLAGQGEAFASSIYREMLFDEELAKSVGSIGILSNGSLFTPEMFDKLSTIWKNIDVFISMDGASKETAEKLRAGVNFEKWKNNMEYLGEMRRIGKIGKLAFNFVVQRSNYLEMPDYASMCLGFHADCIKFSMLGNWGNWSKEEFDRISMFDENGEMKHELIEVVNSEIFLRPEVFLFRWVDW